MSAYLYCLAQKCDKREGCNRYVGHHIINGIPTMLNEKICLSYDYVDFDKKEIKQKENK